LALPKIFGWLRYCSKRLDLSQLIRSTSDIEFSQY